MECAFSSGIEGSDISLLIAERRTVTSSSEGWKDTDLGWLPNKGSHRDTQFSNNLLKEFYSYAGLLVASKTLFRKYFTQEKLRQWDLFKRKEKVEKSYGFLKSENMSGVGNRLEKGYIPRPNDGNALTGVAEKMHHLLDQVESQINEIKEHDESLFNTNGRTLKHEWQMFHHISNVRLIESLSDMSKEMSSLLSRVEQAAKKFSRAVKNTSGHRNSASKKRRNDKKNKNKKTQRFQRNVEKMVNYLLSEEGQKVYNEGKVIYDSDLKIDRELPLSLTASKIRPLVHLLNTANFSHYARCTIVDLIPSTLTTKLLNEMDGDDEDIQSCSDGSSDTDIDMSGEEGN